MAPCRDDRLPPPTGKETEAGFLLRRLFAYEVHCLCAIFGHSTSRGSRYPEAAAVVVCCVKKAVVFFRPLFSSREENNSVCPPGRFFGPEVVRRKA